MKSPTPATSPAASSSCPVCGKSVSGNLGEHLAAEHGREALRNAVLAAKESGMPDASIGAKFGVSFGLLQRMITEAFGANISALRRPKRIKRWEPKDFQLQRTTVWSFRRRGDWATHNGRYRGNWSPYIPRNVILRYTAPGDLVLDYFVGGGTTAVEAKLLGRRCIARDINPAAISITEESLNFEPPARTLCGQGLEMFEPEVSVADATRLSDILSDSVDLICAHPPYAGIIKYSCGIEGDLSGLPLEQFKSRMAKVAVESLRVLKPGGKCAILVGDGRRQKHVVPIGFEMIRTFLGAGFVLKELVIKRQHNCRTSGFWRSRSMKYNFLLLAHEYLPIFEKPKASKTQPARRSSEELPQCRPFFSPLERTRAEIMETTTVWLLPRANPQGHIIANLMGRFGDDGCLLVDLRFGGNRQASPLVGKASRSGNGGLSLVYVRSPFRLDSAEKVEGYRHAVRDIFDQAANVLRPGGYLVFETKDVRLRDALWPMGLLLWQDASSRTDFAIKEIAVLVADSPTPATGSGNLQIVHRYLLVYSRSA